MSEKRCPDCGHCYEPYAGAVERQKHCGALACRRKHKRTRDRAWRGKDAEWRQARQVKVREWARERQYWKHWRSKHPEYRSREALRMKHKRAEAVAKQEVLARQVDELFKYLIARECIAKQDGAEGQRRYNRTA
jgi:hypothetical protein